MINFWYITLCYVYISEKNRSCRVAHVFSRKIRFIYFQICRRLCDCFSQKTICYVRYLLQINPCDIQIKNRPFSQNKLQDYLDIKYVMRYNRMEENGIELYVREFRHQKNRFSFHFFFELPLDRWGYEKRNVYLILKKTLIEKIIPLIKF